MRTEEEERRLSNSEKSSLEVPLEALNRSKLPGRGKRRHTHIKTQRQMEPDGTRVTDWTEELDI